MRSLASDRGYTYVDYFSAMVDDARMMKADLLFAFGGKAKLKESEQEIRAAIELDHEKGRE